ncbi:hypothetical protein AVEN_233993-1, partial [Araneus ventricosus]
MAAVYPCDWQRPIKIESRTKSLLKRHIQDFSIGHQDFSDVVSGQLGDEQAALNKILHQTAIDIIDVSAIPTHIEQKDFIDRVKMYQRRLASVQLRHPAKEKCLLKDLPLPEKILSETPLLLADLKM